MESTVRISITEAKFQNHKFYKITLKKKKKHTLKLMWSLPNNILPSKLLNSLDKDGKLAG